MNKEENVQLEIPTGSRYKSDVWNHFGFPVSHDENNIRKVNRSETVCKICHKRIQYSGNTTNMKTHLQRHHPGAENTTPKPAAKANMKSAPPGQLRLQEAFQSRFSSTSQKALQITRHIGIFFGHGHETFLYS
jgi:hypothetical protein